jgi:hypothetical protein
VRHGVGLVGEGRRWREFMDREGRKKGGWGAPLLTPCHNRGGAGGS